MVADVAVVLLDRERQVLAREQSILWDQPVEALPVVGQEDVALDADPVEKSPAGRIITPTQLPGQGSPCHRVKGRQSQTLFFLGRQSWLAKELFEPAEVGSGIAAELRPQHPGVPTALEARAHLAPALAIDTGQIAGVPAAQPGDETGGGPPPPPPHPGPAVGPAGRRPPPPT